MSLLWIPFTLIAAFMQAWRNAFQNQLGSHVSVMGVTLARFVLALPLSALYLYSLYHVYPDSVRPTLNTSLLVNTSLAAVAQILATALMVALFKAKNYALGVGLAKSEAVIAAILGALFFSAPLSNMAWLGVFIGGLAIWLMSLHKAHNAHTGKTHHTLSLQTAGIGVASGLNFALCTLFIREAALQLQTQGLSFLLSASWVLVMVLLIQTVLLCIWLLIKEPQTYQKLLTNKRLTLAVSVFSLLGSIGWFTAMSIQSVAMVKTLGQVEVLFTLGISFYWFKEPLKGLDYAGLALIVLGACLVVLAA